jgi:translation initiation factor IF-3
MHSDEDYQSKVKHAIRFLKNNDQVKIIVVLKAKEITHPEIGEKLLLKFAKSLEAEGEAVFPSVIGQREVYLLFTPKIAQ